MQSFQLQPTPSKLGKLVSRRHIHFFRPKWLNELTSHLRPAGWASVVHTLSLPCPKPASPLAILNDGASGAFLPPKGWRILPQTAIASDGVELEEHLALAMQHEGPNIMVLGAAVSKPNQKAAIAEAVTNIVLENPQEDWRRRLWFFYEWITGEQLELNDVSESVSFVDALDDSQYYTSLPIPSYRHRVRDNLLGCKDFSPMVRRTKKLEAYADQNFGKRAAQLLSQYGGVLNRDYSYDMVIQETVHSMVCPPVVVLGVLLWCWVCCFGASGAVLVLRVLWWC